MEEEKKNEAEEVIENTIVLQDENGKNMEFILVARIALHGGNYLLLHPNFPLEGLKDNELMAFEEKEGEGDEISYSLVMDEDVIAALSMEYQSLVEQKQAEEQ